MMKIRTVAKIYVYGYVENLIFYIIWYMIKILVDNIYYIYLVIHGIKIVIHSIVILVPFLVSSKALIVQTKYNILFWAD